MGRGLARVGLGLFALSLCGSGAAAQGGREERPEVDPYTRGEAKAMEEAGVVSFGPFLLNGEARTELVEEALGGVPILWMKTEHFVIGSSLEGIAFPKRRDDKKALREELKELGEHLPNIPRKPKRIDPWLRLHLMASRLEGLYRDFESTFGLEEGDFPSAKGAEPYMGPGPYLGMETRFRVLLFEKSSSLVRYTRLYCEGSNESSYRYYDSRLGGFMVGVALEGLEGDYASDRGLTYAVFFSMAQNLVAGFRGYDHRAPLWAEQGIARWFARAYEPRFLHFTTRPGEAARRSEKDALWEQKVRARVGHEVYPKMEQIEGWTDLTQCSLADHMMMWSRVDFLLRQGPDVSRRFLMALEEPVAWGSGREERLAALARGVVQAATGMDLPAFDAAWVSWVLETYPKK